MANRVAELTTGDEPRWPITSYRIERRTRKPAQLQVPVADRFDEVMRNRLHDMFGAI